MKTIEVTKEQVVEQMEKDKALEAKLVARETFYLEMLLKRGRGWCYKERKAL